MTRRQLRTHKNLCADVIRNDFGLTENKSSYKPSKGTGNQSSGFFGAKQKAATPLSVTANCEIRQRCAGSETLLIVEDYLRHVTGLRARIASLALSLGVMVLQTRREDYGVKLTVSIYNRRDASCHRRPIDAAIKAAFCIPADRYECCRTRLLSSSGRSLLGWSQLVDTNIYFVSTPVIRQVIVVQAYFQSPRTRGGELYVFPALYHLRTDS